VNDPFLSKVEFYMDQGLVGESDEAPYGIFWQAKIGRHTLRVVATDLAGNTAETSLVFTVK
jgi:hypothetical protein